MDAGRQIQDGRHVEVELRQSLERAERHVEELTARCEDLEQQLKQETQTREFLSVEFYKADGESWIYAQLLTSLFQLSRGHVMKLSSYSQFNIW